MKYVDNSGTDLQFLKSKIFIRISYIDRSLPNLFQTLNFLKYKISRDMSGGNKCPHNPLFFKSTDSQMDGWKISIALH
jgi:hypothetical protein